MTELSRRRIVRLCGAGGVAMLSGCGSLQGDEDDDGDSGARRRERSSDGNSSDTTSSSSGDPFDPMSSQQSISYGETIEGEITASSPEDEAYRGYHEPIVFEGSANDFVSVELTSDDGDAFLLVEGPAGDVIAWDDDGGEGRSAHVDILRLPEDGEYTIIATTYSTSETLEFELALEEREGSISYGETVEGETTEDSEWDDYYRGYYATETFLGMRGDVVTIGATSDDQTLVLLEGPDGGVVDWAESGGDGYDASLDTVRLPGTEEFRIIVATRDSSTFEYSMSLELVEANDAEVEVPDAPEESEAGDGDGAAGDGGDGGDGGGTGSVDAPYTIRYGQSVSGELTTSSPSAEQYRGYYEAWEFAGSAGEQVTIDMESSDDTYLLLLGPSGDVVTRDDDDGSGYQARIENYRLESTGRYTIIATSYSNRETFEYTLTLRRT